LIPRCNEADAARAVEAASDAFERGAWSAMTATQSPGPDREEHQRRFAMDSLLGEMDSNVRSPGTESIVVAG